MQLMGIDGRVSFERSVGISSMKLSGSAMYLNAKAALEA